MQMHSVDAASMVVMPAEAPAFSRSRATLAEFQRFWLCSAWGNKAFVMAAMSMVPWLCPSLYTTPFLQQWC